MFPAVQAMISIRSSNNSAQDAVGFEDTDGTITAECCRHGAKWLGFYEIISLVEGAAEATPAGPCEWAILCPFTLIELSCVKIPEP